MTMQAESLEVLEGAEIAPAQARAIIRAIEIEMAGASATLATKQDLHLQTQDIRQQIQGIAALGEDLRGEMAALGEDLRGEMAALGKELRAEMAALSKELRGETATLGKDLRGEIAALRAEMHALGSNSLRQMYMALLAQMSVLLGFIYFFAAYVR